MSLFGAGNLTADMSLLTHYDKKKKKNAVGLHLKARKFGVLRSPIV